MPGRSGRQEGSRSRRFTRALAGVVGSTVVIGGGLLGQSGVAAAASNAYVVDGANPACSDATGNGSTAAPYCTIGQGMKVAQPGDTVQVRAATYAETVSPPRDGTAGAPITLAGDPGATITGAPGGNGRGISMFNRSYLVVDGFTVTGTVSYGVYIFGGSHITVSHNDVSGAAGGSYVAGIFLQANVDSAITANHSHGNTGPGIQVMPSVSGMTVTALADRITVSGNETDNNSSPATRQTPGIDVRSGTNTVVDNISHDNQDSGIQFYPGNSAVNPATTTGNLVANNVTYGNGDHGIDDLDATNQDIVANTVYNNVASGINVEGGSTGAILRNNIAANNGINSPRTVGNIRLDTTAINTGSIDSDLVFQSSAYQEIVWGNASYYTLATFQNAVPGQETHGLEGDPRFANAANGNFRLTAGSPAIDSADASASGEPNTDIAGNGRADDQATPNTGLGSPSYVDRGAYEYQPPAVTTSPTSTALSSSAPSAPAGTPVTFTATVSSTGAGTPTGTVTFSDGQTTLGSSPLAPDGTSTFTTSALTVGQHSITAAYGGDSAFDPSTSQPITQTITQPANPTSTALTSSAPTAQVGTPVTFTATVSSTGTGAPTGTVTFSDGQTTLGSSPLATNGTATYTTSALAEGAHSITAAYSGDGAYDPSTSPAFTQTITPVAGQHARTGDYNGDGTTDLAVFRPSTGRWFVRGQARLHLGQNGDIPAAADFTGDGKTDRAVFRPSTGTWYIQKHANVHFGQSGDVPVPADYNGDGKADVAVFRPSTGTWLIQGQPSVQLGQSGDIAVPADYNGDGKADVAVFRPSTGTWLIQGQPSVQLGQSGDVPQPGYYAGGSSARPAVFRPATSTWYVVGLPAVKFGQSKDVPQSYLLHR